MKHTFFIGIALAVVFGLAVALVSIPSVLASDHPDGASKYVIDPTSVAYGRTYSEWSAAWWQWAFSIPVASHPLFDKGDCSIGQSGPVWFLGGQFCISGENCSGIATRSCSVPSGKALYFPVLNVEDSAPEEPNWGCGDGLPPLAGGTIAEMRACAEGFITGINNLEVDIDGKRVRNLYPNFLVTSVQFDATWPEDNVLTAIGEGPFPPGTFSPVVDEGVYVMLSPLPKGNHTIHFQGTWSWGSSQNITYNLNVTK